MRKSEKRSIGRARQEVYRKESIASGLRAQAQDRARREQKSKAESASEAVTETAEAMHLIAEASKRTAEAIHRMQTFASSEG